MDQVEIAYDVNGTVVNETITGARVTAQLVGGHAAIVSHDPATGATLEAFLYAKAYRIHRRRNINDKDPT